MRGFSLLAGALFASCLLGGHSAALRAQPVTPAAPIPLLTGTLTSTGSDTLASLMSGWAADFSRRYPEVGVQIQAMGSAAAAAALAAGTAQLGPMSRPMSEPAFVSVTAMRRWRYRWRRMRWWSWLIRPIR